MDLKKFVQKVKVLVEKELGVELDVKVVLKDYKDFLKGVKGFGLGTPPRPVRGYAGEAMDRLNEIWIVPENFSHYGEGMKIGIVRTLSHELFHVFQQRFLRAPLAAYDGKLKKYEAIVRGNPNYKPRIDADGDAYVRVEAEAYKFQNDFNKKYFPKLVSKTIE
jgi:hypothetical protein